MTQSILELIFRTSKQGTGGKAASQELKELKGTVGEATSGLLGMNLATISGVGAAMAIGSAVVDSTKKFIAYGETIRGLSAITGTGTEATSRLLQAFDDLGVSQEQFNTLATGAAKKGFVMTIDNVAKLADEYNGLSTQEEKNKLLTDQLGKSAMVAAKAFQAGGQAIRDAAAAQADGLVLTEKEAATAEKMRQNVDALTDAWEGFKLELGGAVGGAIVEIQSRSEKLNAVIEATGKQLNYMSKELQDQAIENYDVAKSQEWLNTHFKEGKELLNGYTIGQKTSTQVALDYANAISGPGREGAGTYAFALQGVTKATEGVTGAMQANIVKQGELDKSTATLANGAMTELTREFANQQIMGTLTGDMLLEFMRKQGLVKEDTYQFLLSLQSITAQFDLNKDGVISASEATDAYRLRIENLNGMTATTEVITKYTNIGTPGSPTIAPGPSEIQHGKTWVPDVWGMNEYGERALITAGYYKYYASGGSFVIPPGYNENYPLGPGRVASSGETVTVTPKGKGGAGVGVTIQNVNIYNGMNLESFKRMLMQAVK